MKISDSDRRQYAIGFLERRIERARERIKMIKKSHGDNPGNTHTYHGGWSLGYWEGVLTGYENAHDLLVGLEERE
jgi:hypothetical protein